MLVAGVRSCRTLKHARCAVRRMRGRTCVSGAVEAFDSRIKRKRGRFINRIYKTNLLSRSDMCEFVIARRAVH